jgi:hypothetical protein
MLTLRLSINRVGRQVWDDFAVCREKEHISPIGTACPNDQIRRRPHAPRDRNATFRTPTTKVFTYG